MKWLNNLKQNVLRSNMIRNIYSGVWYFEQGRGQCSRLYGYVPEIMVILMGLKFLFKVEFNTVQLIFLFSGIILLFFILGLIYKKSGLYDKERIVQTNKDPIQTEILNNTRDIRRRLK